MSRAPVLLVLGGVFALCAAGRGGIALAGLPEREHAAPPTEWQVLDDWSAELDQREAAVEAESIAAEIEWAEARRTAHRAVAPRAEEPRRLAALYAALPPDRAAAILSGLPPSDAARILGAMTPVAAGDVLGTMEAEAALAVGGLLPMR